jgi:hypothetical protein
MLTQHGQLTRYEQTTFALLHAIDLDTPLQYLQQALEVLLDIPTVLRRADTPFSEEVLPALYTLASKARVLCDTVDTVTAHVGRPPLAVPASATPSRQGIAVVD